MDLRIRIGIDRMRNLSLFGQKIGLMQGIFRPAVETKRDRTLVGDPQRQRIRHTPVRPQMQPHPPARTGSTLLAVRPFLRKRTHILQRRNLPGHGEIGIHHLHTGRHRPGIVDLHRQTGHKRNRPRLRTGHVIPSEPAVRKLVIRAETRKHAQPHPETVIELMRHIRMRRRPQTGLGIGGLPAAICHPCIDGTRRHMKIETAHDPRAGKLRYPGSIVRQRRRIIRPPARPYRLPAQARAHSTPSARNRRPPPHHHCPPRPDRPDRHTAPHTTAPDTVSSRTPPAKTLQSLTSSYRKSLKYHNNSCKHISLKHDKSSQFSPLKKRDMPKKNTGPAHTPLHNAHA